MNADKKQIEQARQALANEVALLQKKVADGHTLRAGERRYLMTVAESAPAHLAARVEGRVAALEEIKPELCRQCQDVAEVARIHTISDGISAGAIK
jgi:hypothetical protein